MIVNTDNLLLKKTNKEQVSIDIKALVPKACMIGVGNKNKMFFNYLAKQLEANDEKVIDRLSFMMGELASRGVMVVHCSCNCRNQHAEALVAFMKEYKDAIEMFYKVSKHYMTTMGGNNLTLDNCGLDADSISQIKALMMAEGVDMSNAAPKQPIPGVIDGEASVVNEEVVEITPTPILESATEQSE